MTTEEKAKAYDEALKKARYYYEKGYFSINAALVNIFPELKESEDEDKIMKELIYNIIVSNDNTPSSKEIFSIYGKTKKDAIAWLEKQGEQILANSAKTCKDGYSPKFRVGDTIKCKYDDRQFTIKSVDFNKGTYTYTQEGCGNDIDYADEEFELVEQKPADNLEPKFKVGDWVIDKQGLVHQIANVVKIVTYNTYGYDIVGGGYFNDNIEGVRLWTIQDAKDGDVLYSPCCKLLWIYKNENTCYVGYNLNYNSDGIVINKLICIPNDVQPATKEQRDILFAKMREVGYEWDYMKKELNRIE